MKITCIVAASENNVIGVSNQLPWHLPDDLKFFKKNTLGKPILMGKNTWLSLGKPLPGRLNIVLSSTLKEVPEGVMVFTTLIDALQFLLKEHTEEVCIIGGEKVFNATLALADTLYMTRVHTTIPHGDAYFPEINDRWNLIWQEHHAKDEKHQFDFTFQKWEQVK